MTFKIHSTKVVFLNEGSLEFSVYIKLHSHFEKGSEVYTVFEEYSEVTPN